MIPLLLAATAFGGTSLEALERAAHDYPTDYGAQVDFARAAAAAGRFDLAVRAWDRAEALSGGNLEVHLGRLVARVGLGDTRGALADGRAARLAAPELADAWSYSGWAQRHRDPPELGYVQAEASYRQAVTLDPEDAGAWCGLGWMRSVRRDRPAALKAFERAEALEPGGCGAEGVAGQAGPWAVGGDLGLVALAWTDHSWRRSGVWLFGRAGLTWNDTVHADVVFRGFWGSYLGSTGAITSADQQEIWGRVGASNRFGGAEVLVGGVLSGDAVGSGATAVGGRAWGTWWVTLLGEGLWARHDDGNAWQAGLTALAPVAEELTVEAGALATGFTPDADADASVASGTGLSGSAALHFSVERYRFSIGGRGGRELRPVRMEIPAMWNVPEPLIASGWASAGVRALPFMHLSLGYEITRLLESAGDTAHAHAFSFDLSFVHPRSAEEYP